MNSELDGWFVLKALLAPELPIVDLPTDLSAITAAWRQVINAAQQTPLGRARIALATTLGQLPAWVSSTTPEPDPNDVYALQQSMFESLIAGAAQPAGQSRFMFEHSAPRVSCRKTSTLTIRSFSKTATSFTRGRFAASTGTPVLTSTQILKESTHFPG
jgi:hypothetical protein